MITICHKIEHHGPPHNLTSGLRRGTYLLQNIGAGYIEICAAKSAGHVTDVERWFRLNPHQTCKFSTLPGAYIFARSPLVTGSVVLVDTTFISDLN